MHTYSMWYAFTPTSLPKKHISQSRTTEGKIEAIERRGLSCILLHKIARSPAACVNISLCVRVCPVYAESSEQMTALTVRTCAAESTQGLTQLNLLSVESPNQPEWGNVASCDHQYGQQLFGKRLQRIAEFFSTPSQEMKD